MLGFLYKYFEFIYIPALLILYISILYFYVKILFNRKYKKQIFIIINNLFSTDNLNKEHTLNTLVRDIDINKINTNIKSPCDLLEYVFRKVTLNSRDSNKYSYLGIDFEYSTIQKIQEYIILLKKTDPFISLNEQYNFYFSSIYKALNENNSEHGKNMLYQLAKRFEIIDEKILKQQTRNKINNYLTIIGVVLTFVFGIISIVISKK